MITGNSQLLWRLLVLVTLRASAIIVIFWQQGWNCMSATTIILLGFPRLSGRSKLDNLMVMQAVKS
jgi:uncharacterized membrane protein YqjE